jgi:hypothetical protein
MNQLSMPEIQISYPQSQMSSPALRPATAPGGSTRLGVPPPPVRVSRPEISAVMPAKRRENRLWIIVGALLAIAAGIALALALAT